MSRRFTIDGDAALEARLEGICAKVGAGVQAVVPPKTLAGVLLGGAYGLGEGSVLSTPRGDQPGEALSFHALCRGNTLLAGSKIPGALRSLGERLSLEVGTRVIIHFANLEELGKGRASMAHRDMAIANRRILGGEDLLAGCKALNESASIPPEQIAWELLNLCTGLLFAADRLRGETLAEADQDFIARSIVEAQLGFGGVFLAATGEYHHNRLERRKRIAQKGCLGNPFWIDELRRHHLAGTQSKLNPETSRLSKGEWMAFHAEVADLGLWLWLWLEGRRLGRDFDNAREYAASEARKWPESGPGGNAIANLRLLGPSAILRPGLVRHPRERLFHALPLLLWDPAAERDPETAKIVRRELNTNGNTLAEWIESYGRLWRALA